MPTDFIMVKLDFKNAFNSLHRDRMLLALEEIAPELTPYCRLAYAEATVLQFGKFPLLSQVVPQQGDPLGPLLFCLPVQPILQSLSSALTLGYLDDISPGGSTAVVAEDMKRIELECGLMGLQLNCEKCEIITHSGDWMESPATISPISPGEGMSSGSTPIIRRSLSNLSGVQMLRTGTCYRKT